MKLLDFVSRVVILDNEEEEIEPLKQALENVDIDVLAFHVTTDFNLEKINKNRQLIFLDLMLDENVANANTNISRAVMLLSQMVSDKFGAYGLVIWTKHEDHIVTLKEYIDVALKNKEDGDGGIAYKLEIPPVFIVPLNKKVYLEKGDDYSSLLDDIEASLKNSAAGYFFLSWGESVKQAFNKSITDVYSVCDYKEYENQIKYILYILARNYTGAPIENENLSVDCYKSFDELLYADLFMQQKNENLPSFIGADKPDNPWIDKKDEYRKIIATLNAKMFLDFDAISQGLIVPGNVYKLCGNSLEDKVKDKVKILEESEHEEYESVDIAIELTPPCDFSNKKIRSRVIYGYAFELFSKDEVKSLTGKEEINKLSEKYKDFQKRLRAENRYLLRNILIEGKYYCILFDYRYLFTPSDDDLQDEQLYKIWFRAKPKLFADILQKFSSHASRLGLSDLH